MVTIEKVHPVVLSAGCPPTPLSDVQFQRHPGTWRRERLAVGHGSSVLILGVADLAATQPCDSIASAFLTPPEKSSLTRSEWAEHYARRQASIQSQCSTNITCLATLEGHAPQWVLGIRWSGQGQLASFDSNKVLIWDMQSDKPAKRLGHKGTVDLECWQTSKRLLEVSSQEFFDCAWFSEDYLLTGGIRWLKLWNTRTGRCEAAKELLRGTIVKGVACHENRVCCVTDEPWVGVFQLTQCNGEWQWASEWSGCSLIKDKLLDSIRPSFDPTGQMVALPGGCSRSSYFGVGLKLWDLAKTDPYRFRGHQSKVNMASMASDMFWFVPACYNGLADSVACPDGVSVTGMDVVCAKLVEGLDATWPRFSFYLQASLDGCISLWQVHTQPQSPTLEATCAFVLRPGVLDEQAMVSGVSFSPGCAAIAVSSTDGSLTLIRLAKTEFPGIQIPSGSGGGVEPADWTVRAETRESEEAPLTILQPKSKKKPAAKVTDQSSPTRLIIRPKRPRSPDKVAKTKKQRTNSPSKSGNAEELDEEDWFVLNGMPGLVSSSPEEASGALRSGILIGLESAAEGVTAALALSLEAALDSLKPLSPLREFVDSCSALLLVVPLVELGRLTGAMTSLLNLTDAVDPGSSTESLIEVIRAASLNHELLGAAARLT